jgi:hypothetical protein
MVLSCPGVIFGLREIELDPCAVRIRMTIDEAVSGGFWRLIGAARMNRQESQIRFRAADPRTRAAG